MAARVTAPRSTLGLLLLATVPACGLAANETSHFAGQMTGVVTAPPGDPIAGGAARTWEVAAPRAPGKRTLLYLEVRMDNPVAAGCNYGMSITVNGRDLGTARDWMNGRLIGKTPVAHVKNSPAAKGPWYRGGCWLLMYAPDSRDGQIEEGDDCRFLWDVTDLLRADGRDVVRIESQTKRLEEQLKRPVPVAVDRLQLGLTDAALLETALATPPPVPPVADGAKLVGKGFACWTAPGGGMALTVGKETFRLRSRLTYPGQPQGGWNLLDCAPTASGEPGWKPAARKGPKALTVEARGRTYSLSREVALKEHRLLVRDTFRNLTDRIVGVRFRNEIDCTGQRVADVALCGDRNPDHCTDETPGDNPTLFVKLASAGLGMLAEDDVYRVQCRVEFSYPAGLIGSEHFGLAPQAAYTVEWSLYPTASGDAWDFLNRVRRDWNVNFTIPAGSVWTDCSALLAMKDEDLKRYVEWSGGRWIMATPWLDTYPLPTRPTREQIAATASATAEKLHRVCPEVTLLLGTHPTMNFSTPGRFYDGEDYRDSWVLDEQGKHFWSPVYTQYFCVGIAKEQGFLNYCNFMVPGNPYFRKMMDEADFALGQAKVGGIYCDEFNHYNCVSSRTYGRWDQHYVDLDEATFEPKTGNPCAQLSLVTDAAQQQYAEHILGKGAAFLANAQPVTRRMQGMRFPRFIETPFPARGFHSALFSPLAYGNDPPSKDEAALFQFVRDRVECCVLTHIGGMPQLTRPCVTARMYPFTPTDIRPGVLTGAERIITTRSGAFGWAPPFRARLFVYDRAGVLAEADPPLRAYPRPVAITVPEQGLAILERAAG